MSITVKIQIATKYMKQKGFSIKQNNTYQTTLGKNEKAFDRYNYPQLNGSN